jgi:phage gpG-like protein
MTFEASIQIEGQDELNRFIRQLPETMFENAKTAFARAVLKAHEVVRTENFTSGNTGYSSNKLNSRTGDLSRSIRTQVKGSNLESLAASIYTNSVYAPIHEIGGTIRAKNKYVRVPGGPYLNIPLSANKTAAGVMRRSAREVFSAGGYIIRSQSGNWIVMSVNSTPMFVLKKAVYIRPRLGMVKASEDRINEIMDYLDNASLE